MLKASNYQRGIIASRPGQMYSWPGLIRVNDHELLAIASERKHHVCPFGREVIMRSFDAGDTWSLPEEIYNSELDDRDGTLAILPDGTITASWFTSSEWMNPTYMREEWAARRDRVTRKMLDELGGSWLLRSKDGGHTWDSAPHAMPEWGAAHSGPFALSDGRLITFGYDTIDNQVETCAFTSQDQGLTWQRLAVVPSLMMMPDDPQNEITLGVTLPTSRLNERAFLEITPTHYLVLFRAVMPEVGSTMLQSESTDGGLHWTMPAELPFWGLPAHLLKLSNGAILCTYGHRRDPWSIRAILSYDNGQSWDVDNIITLDEWDDQPDMGYPMSLELQPGRILTIYYASRQPILHQAMYEKDYKRGSTPEGLLYVKYMLS